jgi:hypothetical protein
MLVVWIIRTNISLRIVPTQIASRPEGKEKLMHCRRWLVVGLCFCIFSGCKTCQSTYDYCGPLPAEGGDFMYRKNSVLGGDPAMKPIDEEPPAQADETEENGPEPTPAPPPDEAPRPGIDADDDSAEMSFDDEMGDPADGLADEEQNVDLLEEGADDEVAEDGTVESAPATASLQWHAPGSKRVNSPVKQIRFQGE